MIYHNIFSRFQNAVNIVPALCALAIVGAAVYSLLAPAPSTPELDTSLNTTTVLEGVVIQDPDVREKTIRLVVEVEKTNSSSIYGTTRVLISVDRFSDVSYGDYVIAKGKLQKPESFETDTGRTFDYPTYLRAHGIAYELSFANVTTVAKDKGNSIVAWLLSVKHTLLDGINTALPEPESALLAGLLIGEKQSLGELITESFRRAGVVHIIVLSGYNVAIVIAVVLFITSRLFARPIALAIAGAFILAFAIMTGASETTIRASGMALIVLFAKFLHRPTDGIRILLIAAAGMALWNPFLVLFDLSYQLSILATLGLILFSDPLAQRMRFIPETLGLREVVATTISTQITVLPLLILSVGSVSLVSLVTNVLVLPAVAGAMLFGFIAGVAALLSNILAFPFIVVAYAILHYIITVSVWFGNLPFAAIPIQNEWTWPSLMVLTALYGAVFFIYFSKRKTLN